MRELKTFAVAGLLLLITAAILSAKPKYSGYYAIYSFDGTSYFPLVSSSFLTANLTTSPFGQQAILISSFSNIPQPLWGYSPSVGYVRLYTRF